MAIQRQLAEAAFGPADVRVMTSAYEAALKLLKLNDKQDPITELIASKIIEIYRQGENDPPQLCARALKELGVPIPD
jgi:hypothetical protein